MRLALLLLLPLSFFAQNLVIPDPFLKACIVSQHDSNGDGEISAVEAALIREIRCEGREIESLEGIQQFPLTVLEVNQNRLTSVAQVTQLSQLETLEFGENQVSAMPDLSGLAQLRYLYCGSNRLTQLGSLPAGLLELNCSGNGLTQLPSLPMNLESLRCDWNELEQAPTLTGMTRLTALSIGHNPFRVLPSISHLTNLLFLDLEGLGQTSIPDLSPFTELVGLSIGENPLTELPSFSAMDLQYLGISRLGLTALPDLSGQRNLAVLYAQENQLTSAAGIAGLTKMEYLNMSYNRLTDFPALGDFDSMCCLFLQDNELREVPAGLAGASNLTILFLENNRLDFGDCVDLLELADRSGMLMTYATQKELNLDCRNLGELRSVVPWVVQNSQYSSRVSLFNGGESDTSALLTAVSRNGERLQKVLELPSKRVVTRTSEELFGALSGYSILIHSPSEQVYPSFLAFNLQSASRNSPAQTIGMRSGEWGSHLLFGYLPGDMIPAIVLSAPSVNEGTTAVDLMLYTDTNAAVRTVRIELSANQPYAALVKDIFALEQVPLGAAVEVRSANQTPLAGTTFVFNSFLEPSMSVPFRLDP